MSGGCSSVDANEPGASFARHWRVGRSDLVRLHRYVGLVIAGFLLQAGITGSLLAWNHELEAWSSPELWRIKQPHPNADRMDPLLIRDRIQALYPGTFVARVPLSKKPNEPVVLRLYALPDPATGEAPELANDEVFVDPYSGKVLGQRKWGDLSQGVKNLMPFIYRLHHSLLLGDVGSLAMGVIALLWTLDCFVGAWLTLPARQTRGRPGRRVSLTHFRAWLSRWRISWSLRWFGSSSYRRHLDVHRVAGLWPWAMLFVLAWSAVAFNLREVHDPIMNVFFAHQQDVKPSDLDAPRLSPKLDWQDARQRGRALMSHQAERAGFAVLDEDALSHDPRSGVYSYRVRSTRDAAERWGLTQVSFDADTGALLGVWLPTGSASGDTIRTWFTTLHMAGVWGWPMQLVVCAAGLAVAALSVTGVVIWWRKRTGRRKLARRGSSLGL